MTDQRKERAKAEQLDRAHYAMKRASELLPNESYDRITALIAAREEISRTIMFLRKAQ